MSGRLLACGLSVLALLAAHFPNTTQAAEIAPMHKAGQPGWSGLYIGLHVGHGSRPHRQTSFDPNDPAAAAFVDVSTPSISPGTLDLAGLLGGVQAGYNWQIGSRWIAGVEADFALPHVEDAIAASYTTATLSAVSSSASEEVKWFGTLRGRLGYLLTDNLMLFGTGGLAYGRVEQDAFITNLSQLSIGILPAPQFTCAPVAICFAGSARDISLGWTLGGGFEYALDGHWRVKADYLYVNLGSTDYAIQTLYPNGGGVASFTVRSGDAEFHLARIGLNYRF
jgi:outer membrane immunogenic protein